MTIYLDHNATTPINPGVLEVVQRHLTIEFGNAGSRTHAFGARAKRAVERARKQVASALDASSDEVIFTSGATESDNLAILGLAAHGEQTGRRHIITTAIEHKAVLEPLKHLEGRGFEVARLVPERGGRVSAEAVAGALRDDTLLVSVMCVNNETGVSQPLDAIGAALDGHEAYFHSDAAAGFGKVLAPLQSKRLDLISVSGHKLFAPQGVGALLVRRRGFDRVPLAPLMFGGGQERGLRPGTLPVALIAGLGEAVARAVAEAETRSAACAAYRETLLEALAPFKPELNGDPAYTLPSVLNVALPGVDAEALMLALKDVVAISNGSACTSRSYTPSHVLEAMFPDEDRWERAVRFSWSHASEALPGEALREALAAVM